MNRIFLILIFIVFPVYSMDDTSRETIEKNEELMGEIDRIDQFPLNVKLDKLVRIAAIDYRERNTEWDTTTKKVAARARAMAIEIPGHAEFVASEMEEARRVTEENNKVSIAANNGPNWTNFDDRRNWAFKRLTSLPSAESVRVLGRYLDDRRDEIPKELLGQSEANRGMGASANYAAMALTAIGIESPPVATPPDEGGFKDVDAWKLWFAQVKAGTRTYRFKGNPQNYGYDGPVDQEKSPLTAGAVSGSSRTGSLADGSRAETASAPPGTMAADKNAAGGRWPITPLLVSLAVLSLGGAAYLKSRRIPGK